MKQDVIDLTEEPEYIYVDADEPTNTTRPLPDAPTGSERERKRSRRKKRKRTLTEGESTPSASHTREASPAEGKIETRKPSEVLHDLLNGKAQRKERTNTDNENLLPLLTSPASPQPKDAGNETLFFIDVEPIPLPIAAQFASTSTASQNVPNELLLPAHVSVFGAEPAEILAPDQADSDDDYIDYLDFDDSNRNIVRYFEDPVPESSKPNRTVCKNCGAEGKHTTATCPVMICLTCGARDEHGTRSCPISKTCFTCGMKGHINATCPNRRAARRGELDRYDDCDRCGSERHKANECPTLWRLYDYLTEEAKSLLLQRRKGKQHLNLGEGGEGYIADDEWCYNCGNFGHWGDDCQDVPHREDLPEEYSAFSKHNTLSGPFFDSVTGRSEPTARRREPHSRKLHDDLPPSWGNVPDNVGKKGRRDNAAKMGRKAQELAVDDDVDDWFGNSQNARNRGSARNHGNRNPDPPKKLAFGKSLQESSRHFQPPSPPKLLDRIGETYYSGQSRSRRRDSRDSRPPRKPDRDYRRDDRYERDRDRDWHRRDDAGPRYKGGYSR